MVWIEFGYGLGIGFVVGGFAVLYAGWRTGWLQERVYRLIDVYIEDFVGRVEKNPQILNQFMKPVIKAAMSQLNALPEKEASIKIPGIGRIPLSAIQAVGQVFGGTAKAAAQQGVKDLLAG